MLIERPVAVWDADEVQNWRIWPLAPQPISRLPPAHRCQGCSSLDMAETRNRTNTSGFSSVGASCGMVPTACLEHSNYFSELEPRYGIEP